MVQEKDIKVTIIGEISKENRRNYARALARALMEEYGKETCEKILQGLKDIQWYIKEMEWNTSQIITIYAQ